MVITCFFCTRRLKRRKADMIAERRQLQKRGATIIPYPRIFIKAGREKPLLQGHPWLFSGAVDRCDRQVEPGAPVLAVAADGRPLAVGFYHPRNNIAFRCLSRDPERKIDASFIAAQVKSALTLRAKLLDERTDSYRLINAEGDGLPGLIVDRYGKYLILSISTAGMEHFQGALLKVLKTELKPEAIYERSEGRSRNIEGLPARTGPAYGRVPPTEVEIRENGLAFVVDIVSGQKTGFYLDQRISRKLAADLSPGARVLNCFSYSGGFSVYAGSAGARFVTSVDASPAAIRLAEINWRQNGLSPERHLTVAADVFDFLHNDKNTYDLVILDPPAFAKSSGDISRATAGYREINRRGAQRLVPGGILLTFSCSNFIDDLLFEKTVLGAANDAGRFPRLLGRLGPGPDHPTDLGHPEGRYLKGLMLSL